MHVRLAILSHVTRFVLPSGTLPAYSSVQELIKGCLIRSLLTVKQLCTLTGTVTGHDLLVLARDYLKLLSLFYINFPKLRNYKNFGGKDGCTVNRETR